MRLKNIFFLAIITLISCNKKASISINQDIKYQINISKSIKINNSLGEYISNFKYIRLKNIPIEDFIFSITKVVFFENNFYVLDARKSNLFVFDSNGEYIRKIGKRGNGPGEYKSANDFIINSQTKEITILGINNIALFVYSLESEFIKKIQFDDFYPKKIELLNDSYVLYTSYSSNINQDLIYTNLKGKEIGYGFKYPEDIDQISFDFSGGITKSYDNLLYTGSSSSDIYEIDNNYNSRLKYRIDLGENSWQSSSKFELHKFDRELRRMNISFLLDNYIENNDILFFSFMDKSKEKQGFYNISNNKVYTTDSFSKDGMNRFFNNICGKKDNLLIASFNPQYYEGLANKYKGFKNSIKNINFELYNNLEAIKSDEDPILLLFNFNL